MYIYIYIYICVCVLQLLIYYMPICQVDASQLVILVLPSLAAALASWMR